MGDSGRLLAIVLGSLTIIVRRILTQPINFIYFTSDVFDQKVDVLTKDDKQLLTEEGERFNLNNRDILNTGRFQGCHYSYIYY
jgi:hypothetical protein